MYQMYLAARMIAAGGNFLGWDRVAVRKDIRLAGGSPVDSYAQRPRLDPCPDDRTPSSDESDCSRHRRMPSLLINRLPIRNAAIERLAAQLLLFHLSLLDFRIPPRSVVALCAGAFAWACAS